MDMFNVILNLCDPSEDMEDEEDETEEPLIQKERADMIKTKIRSVGRLCRLFTTLREEHESIVLLKGLAGGQLPQGLLTQGSSAIRDAVTDFKSAKTLDMANERVPPGTRPLTKSDSFSDPLKKKTITEMRNHKVVLPQDSAESTKISIKVDVLDEEAESMKDI